MILFGKLNQKCLWEKKLHDDDYGDSVYDVPIEICCRKEGGNRLIRDKRGKDVIVSATFYLDRKVEPDDRLDGLAVANVYEMVDIKGKTIGWEAVCCEYFGWAA